MSDENLKDVEELSTEKTTSRKSFLKPVLFVAWIGLLAATWYAIENIDTLFIRSGDALAELELSNGTVEYRPGNVALWLQASGSQKFYDGDFVSTSPESTARILFSDGRSIDMDENSQILISVPQNTTDGDLIVDLLSGHVVAKIAPKPKTTRKSKPVKKLIVKSIEKKFVLASSNNAIGLSKNTPDGKAKITGMKGRIVQREKNKKEKIITRKVTKVKAPPKLIKKEAFVKPLPRIAKPKPNKTPKRSFQLASNEKFKLPDANVLDLGSGAAPIFTAPIEEKKVKAPTIKPTKADIESTPIPEPEPEPVPEPKKKAAKATPVPTPEVKIAAIPKVDKNPPFNSRIYMPTLERVPYKALWTTSSLSSSSLRPINVVVKAPKAKRLKQWTPTVKVGNYKNRKRSKSIKGKRSFSTQRIALKSKVYKRYASRGIDKFYPSMGFTVSAGARIKNDDKLKYYSGSSKQKFRIFSLADFDDTPATINLMALELKTKKEGDWIEQSEEIPASRASYKITLSSAKNLPKLAPVLNRSFSITPGAAELNKSGAFFLKGGEVYGVVTGSKLTPANISSLVKQLGVNFAFDGTRKSYKKLPASEEKKIKLLKYVLKKRGRVTIVTANAAFEVNKTIITKDQKLLIALAKKALGYLPKNAEIHR